MHLPIAARRLVDAVKTFARTIPAALPQWSRPFCQQHRSILTHSNALSTRSNAIQRFCCCRGRVRTILPLPARPPPFFRYPSPFAVKTAPSKTACPPGHLTAEPDHRKSPGSRIAFTELPAPPCALPLARPSAAHRPASSSSRFAHLPGAKPTQYGRSKPSKAPPLLALYLTAR